MKTLREHNDDVLKQENNSNAGVLCDRCGAPMYFPHPGMLMISSPAQMDVQCSECAYKSRMYVSSIYRAR